MFRRVRNVDIHSSTHMCLTPNVHSHARSNQSCGAHDESFWWSHRSVPGSGSKVMGRNEVNHLDLIAGTLVELTPDLSAGVLAVRLGAPECMTGMSRRRVIGVWVARRFDSYRAEGAEPFNTDGTPAIWAYQAITADYLARFRH